MTSLGCMALRLHGVRGGSLLGHWHEPQRGVGGQDFGHRVGLWPFARAYGGGRDGAVADEATSAVLRLQAEQGWAHGAHFYI